MKTLTLAFFMMLLLTACTPGIGVGVGVAGISGHGVTATEVTADSETGVHGSIGIGFGTLL